MFLMNNWYISIFVLTILLPFTLFYNFLNYNSQLSWDLESHPGCLKIRFSKKPAQILTSTVFPVAQLDNFQLIYQAV